MKALMSFIFIFILILASLSSGMDIPPAKADTLKAETGSVKGIVSDENDNPLAGANIVVIGTTWGAEADEKGNYLITGIRAGKHTLKAEFIGYAPKEIKNIIVKDNSINSVNFELKQILLRFDSVSHTLSGLVEDTNDKPLENAKISIIGTELSTQSDSLGSYNIPNVERGFYSIKIELEGYETFSRDSFPIAYGWNLPILFVKLNPIQLNPRDIDIGDIEKLEVTPVYKPIIYLYPEKETEVNVKLNYKGTFTSTYPKYPENGWTVTAKSDGTLKDKSGKEYYSLFWEGVTERTFNIGEGFVIKRENSIEFLENSLKTLGLNFREANEFIIFWLPELEKHPYNLIHFSTKEYEELAELTVTPAPDTVIRVFMVFKGHDKPVEVKPQTLVPKVRKGFTVVEWGGSEMTSPKSIRIK